LDLSKKFSKEQIRELDSSIKTNKQIAEISRLAAQDENRAFVNFETLTLDTADKKFVVTVHYRNTGKTIAYNTAGRGICHVSANDSFLDSAFIKQFEYESYGAPKEALGPGVGGSVLWPIDIPKMIINEGTATDQYKIWKQDTTKRIYIIGAVSYDDIYKRNHTTHFFGEYLPKFGYVTALYKYNEAN
jgi:hypothetical protein